MHEGLRQQNDRPTDDGAVRIVRVDDVAAVRRSFPDSAIVAVVGSTVPEDAIAARLAGADVVLPCPDPEAPDPAELGAACDAARVLARRAQVSRDETRRAAHDFAGTSSAVAMAAQLLDTGATERRVTQLQELASRGAELAWRGGRAGRSGGGPVERTDLITVVQAFCRAAASEPVPPVATAVPPMTAVALVDRVGLTAVLSQLVDNARRAGATAIRIGARPNAHTSGAVDLVVGDDGSGLPGAWAAGTAARPFVTGWAEPSDGLGLCEATEFAVDHGGALHVTNRPDGRGVDAVLTLPVLAADRGGGRDAATARRPDAEWAVARVLEGIARRAPLGESLEALVVTMEEHLPGSRCSILLLDPDDDSLHHGAGARLSQPYRCAIDGVRIGPAVGSCGTAAYLRDEVVVRDIASDRRWEDYRDLALLHRLRSCWSTPVLDVDRGVVLGTFAVYHAAPWVPDPVATGLVQRLTHVAAVAISTAGLHARLVESEACFRSTFETTGLGLALVGPDGRVVQANQALGAMMNRSVDGERLADLLDPADAVAVTAAMTDSLRRRSGAGDSTFRQAEVRLRPSGTDEPVWAALGGSVVCDHAGDARYFCVELFDLTERRRVAQARRATAVAEAASQAKSELLALVSHELRTPLNAVIGFAQVLQSMEITPEQRGEGVAHILGAGRHLLRLINDLLDLTGAESGRLQLDVQHVATSEVVDEAMEIVSSLARERSITMTAPEPTVDHHLVADPQRLRQVLLNLLGNAIKFTDPGGSVSITVEPGRVSVHDTGPGIAEQEIAGLFVPFRRRAGSQEGSGLGLALSQRLTTAMNGHLGVHSVVGAGTTFWVDLPVAEPIGSRSAAQRTGSSAAEPSGRVLYLEDDPASRQLVRSALARWPEVTVSTAACCADARAMLAVDAPDLLVLDVELPDGNGWDLLREVSDAWTVVPTTVVVTAGSSAVPADLDTVETFGKPLVIDEFLRVVSGALTRAHHGRTRPRRAP